jgi:hypothetical protein
MPHGYKHANLRYMPFEDAKELVIKCLDIFSEKLEGFKAEQSIFNFPYNASTPQLEDWLKTRVRAVRTAGRAIRMVYLQYPWDR